jgi:hypothetical protein
MYTQQLGTTKSEVVSKRLIDRFYSTVVIIMYLDVKELFVFIYVLASLLFY